MTCKQGDYKIVQVGPYVKEVYIFTAAGWAYRETFVTEEGARRYIRKRVVPPKAHRILYQGDGKDL